MAHQSPFAYIIHWNGLVGRQDNVNLLTTHLREVGRLVSGSKTGVSVRIVTDPSPEGMDVDRVRQLVAPDASALPPLPAVADETDRGATLTAAEHGMLAASMTGSILVRQVSNALKHHAALHEAGASSGPDSGWRLILEDDACLVSSAEVLADLLRKAPDTADVIMLGLPAPQIPQTATAGSLSVEEHTPLLSTRYVALPHCDSYAIRVGAARRLAAAFMPVRFPTHLNLWYHARVLGLRVHVTSPNVMFVDGSKYGLFVTSIDVNNRLWLNSHFCDLEAALSVAEAAQTGADKAAAMARVDAVAATASFRDHPDMLHLLAKAAVLGGRRVEAEEMFRSALDMYTRSGSPLNERSRFMLDYVALFKEEPLPIERI